MKTFQEFLHESRSVKAILPILKIEGKIEPPIAIGNGVYESYEWDDGEIEANVTLYPEDPRTNSSKEIEVDVTNVVVSQLALYKKDSTRPYVVDFKAGVPTWAKGIVDDIKSSVEAMRSGFDTSDVDFLGGIDEAMGSGAVTGLPSNLGTYQRVYPSPLVGNLRPKWNRKKKRKLKESVSNAVDKGMPVVAKLCHSNGGDTIVDKKFNNLDIAFASSNYWIIEAMRNAGITKGVVSYTDVTGELVHEDNVKLENGRLALVYVDPEDNIDNEASKEWEDYWTEE